MRLLSLFTIFAASAVASVSANLESAGSGNHGVDDRPERAGRQGRGHGAPGGGGPLATACKDKEDGDLCEVEMGMGDDDPERDSKTKGICNKMLDGDLHCRILHPSALVCLGLDEGTNCSFTHRGSDREETGNCVKQPHGVVCHPAPPEGHGRDDGHLGGGRGGRAERFADACKDKSKGDACELDMPEGMANEFVGVCEEPRHARSSENTKLRCRMLSPMEAACQGKEEGAGCNITMHAHGAAVSEAGECKEAVRGELHCRHIPKLHNIDREQRGETRQRQRGRGDGSSGALDKALRGIGEDAHGGANLRKFPAPKHNHPSPSDSEDDRKNSKAPAPKSSKTPAPSFHDKNEFK